MPTICWLRVHCTMVPSMAEMPTAVITNQMPVCSVTLMIPAFCMNLMAMM